MVHDIWKFADSMDMIKQTYVTRATWNGKTKVDEGCRASLVRIDVSEYPDPCVIAFGYRKWNAGGGDMASDWQHLFSFGTHNNNGGDNPTAPLAFYNTRGVPGCGNEYLGVFSYVLIGDNLSDGLFIRYPTYFDGKDLYGILKKDDGE